MLLANDFAMPAVDAGCGSPDGVELLFVEEWSEVTANS